MPRHGERRETVGVRVDKVTLKSLGQRAMDEGLTRVAKDGTVEGNVSELVRLLVAYGAGEMPKGWRPEGWQPSTYQKER